MKDLSSRIDFSKLTNLIEYPDFLDVQLQSYKDFFQLETPPENRDNEGLFKVFIENFPISDSRDNFVLEFIDYTVDPPKYSVNECIDRGLTYSLPLKAKLRLICNDEDNDDFETIVSSKFKDVLSTNIEGICGIISSTVESSPPEHDIKNKINCSTKEIYNLYKFLISKKIIK